MHQDDVPASGQLAYELGPGERETVARKATAMTRWDAERLANEPGRTPKVWTADDVLHVAMRLGLEQMRVQLTEDAEPGPAGGTP